MECNRDEAIRAKSIAEEKIRERDFATAKKFALKAKSLYPGVEGLPQMLTTIDVYISAENKISGEIDWYGVLGVNPSADDDTVRKQYRKLALILHPDKNKSVGGDGAFKLLSEAWSLLSDKAKRLEYNLRRSSRSLQPKVPTQAGGRTATPHTNGFHNFSNRTTSSKKTQNNTAWQNPSSAPPSQQRSDTFWTICHRCKMHYEYLKVYINNTLLCPNCHKAFLASETPPPFNFSKSSNSPSHQNLVKNAAAAQNLGGTARFGSTEPSVAAKAAHIVQRVNEKMKREREELHATTGREDGNRPLKNRRGLDDNILQYGGNIPSQTGMGNNAFQKHGCSGVNGKPTSSRELTQLEIRSMLMKKAQVEIRKKLKELNLKTATKAADTKKEKEANIFKGKELNKNGESSATRGAYDSEKHISSTSADQENVAALSMNVPDADFHDFDGDRTESSFEDNQVWAAYDDDDGMPRFYAMIHKVISRKRFKMKISWLNSKSNSEFGPLNWVGSGFFKTCGEFRIGKHEMNKYINSFSHKVSWTKGGRGAIQILPKKGNIWALYKYWSPEWNEHTPDEVIHKYDMVEVLEDYNEETGAIVAPLIKVAGFRTVFHTHVDPDKIMKIPREEMFRFSHRVPNYLLTGQEAPNAPKGCQELDPAATPLELLQVISEANEVPAKDHVGKVEEDISGSGPKIRKNEAIDAVTRTKLEETVENGQEA